MAGLLSHAANPNELNNTITKIAAVFFMIISFLKVYKDKSIATIFIKNKK